MTTKNTEKRRTFYNEENIIDTLSKGIIYISSLDKLSDSDLQTESSELITIINKLSSGLQNGHTPTQKKGLSNKCLKQIDAFNTALYKYDSNLYNRNRCKLGELYTAITYHHIMILNSFF